MVVEIGVVLGELGLSKNEIKVYIALLELGSDYVGKIINGCGLHRPRVHEALNRLIEKGLVSYVIRENRHVYEAADPERFLDLLKEKAGELEGILPELNRIKSAGDRRQQINIYEGTTGVRTICNKILSRLKTGGGYVDFGVSGLFREVMGAYWEFWQNRKREWGIKSRCIFDESVKKREPSLLKHYYGEVRFVPKEYFSPTDTMVYLDTVVLFIWTASPPIAIEMINKETANGYRNYFELLWKNASE